MEIGPGTLLTPLNQIAKENMPGELVLVKYI